MNKKPLLISLFSIVLFTGLIGLILQVNNDNNVFREPASAVYGPYVYFSNVDLEKAYIRMYPLISNAKNFVYLTLHTWMDNELFEALLKASKRTDVKIVLNPQINLNANQERDLQILLKAKVSIKKSFLPLREKILIVDGTYAVNMTGNFNTIGKKRSNENTVFHKYTHGPDEMGLKIIQEFIREFALIYDSSTYLLPPKIPVLMGSYVFQKDGNLARRPASEKTIELLSNLVDFEIIKNNEEAPSWQKGQYLIFRKKKDSNTIQDEVIKAIEGGQKSIQACMPYLQDEKILNALIDAANRGVTVRIMLDGQDFIQNEILQNLKDIKNMGVHFKYYSHAPHPRYWRPINQSFLLIDYNEAWPERANLFSGPYSFARNAEESIHNMLVYRSNHYFELYHHFNLEFERLWNLNRKNGKPKKEIIDLFYRKVADNSYSLHISNAVSLDFAELQELREQLSKLSPGIFDKIQANNNCMFYNPEKKDYWGACMNEKQ